MLMLAAFAIMPVLRRCCVPAPNGRRGRLWVRIRVANARRAELPAGSLPQGEGTRVRLFLGLQIDNMYLA